IQYPIVVLQQELQSTEKHSRQVPFHAPSVLKNSQVHLLFPACRIRQFHPWNTHDQYTMTADHTLNQLSSISPIFQDTRIIHLCSYAIQSVRHCVPQRNWEAKESFLRRLERQQRK